MKKNLLIVGVILALSFALLGCDEFGTGTVIVQNNSTYSADNPVYVDISNANDPSDVLVSRYNVGRNQQVTFTNVPAGVSYRVWVGEYNGTGYHRSSASFTVSNGQTRTFKYNGISITQ
ncbi:MAG: hypothetical protein FWD14_04485 [Treponema sp.]|nr:hypothetical protein [Treponema sp.]